MAVKKFKPTSPGIRQMTVSTFEEITATKPEKSLLAPLSKQSGRNNQGRITVRHRGGGHKRQYRIIDFKRTKDNVPAKVASIEYDPNRTANIALLHYADGEKRYILAPAGISVGTVLYSGPDADIKPGNCLPLSNIPVGTLIHNIELKEGKGGLRDLDAAGDEGDCRCLVLHAVHMPLLASVAMRLTHVARMDREHNPQPWQAGTGFPKAKPGARSGTGGGHGGRDAADSTLSAHCAIG